MAHHDVRQKSEFVIIQYDIYSILASVDFIIDLYGIIPDESCEQMLWPEERVAYALAELHVIGGSGMTTIVDNSNYDLIRRVVTASKELPDSDVKRSIELLEHIHLSFGFPADTNSWIDYAYSMDSIATEDLRNIINEEIDGKFFFRDIEFTYFQDIQNLAREYIEKHIDVFKKRK